MLKQSFLLSVAAIMAAAAAPASAAQLIQNGTFSNGLAGWTPYTTANGTAGGFIQNGDVFTALLPTTASFDVTGSGAQSALFLNVGVLTPPFGGTPQGGGVFQTVSTTGGVATFSASIAAYSRTGNIAGGIFSVLVDNVALASIDFGDIGALQTERGTLSFATTLSAGTHIIALQAVRPFGAAVNVTSQYFTNVSLDVAGVPEPTTWAMLVLGFGFTGGAMRRRGRPVLAA